MDFSGFSRRRPFTGESAADIVARRLFGGRHPDPTPEHQPVAPPAEVRAIGHTASHAEVAVTSTALEATERVHDAAPVVTTRDDANRFAELQGGAFGFGGYRPPRH